MPHLTDLEELVLTCRSDASRSLIQEALSCYRAQAYRSCIVSTWISVVYDFVGKLRDLSTMGDRNAQRHLTEFESICQGHDVRKSLEFERQILEMAKNEFELLSELEHAELTRLLDDRHKCAHPSMHSPAEEYRPSAEAARYHLRNAVELFLQRPPAQGKAALDRLTRELDQQFYPESIEDLLVHLAAGPLARPRESLLRNFLLVALKYLFAPQPAPATAVARDRIRYDADQLRRERRVILTVTALHRLHGEAAVGAIANRLDQLVASSEESRLALAVQLFSSVPEAWYALRQAQHNRLVRFVRQMPADYLLPGLRLAWDLEFLHAAAEERFANLLTQEWYRLGDAPFPADWLSAALTKLEASTNWDRSNAIIRGVLMPGVADLTIADIDRVIRTAQTNLEIRDAFGFAELLTAATNVVGLDFVVESLGRYDLLENMRPRVSWVPDDA